MELGDVRPVALFVAAHHRMPHLGDDVAPWLWCGWLRMYVQEISALHADVPDRWGYLGAIHAWCDHPEHTRWPKSPIPQVSFTTADTTVLSDLRKYVEIAAQGGRHSYGWHAFRAFVQWLGYALGTEAEPSDLPPEVQEQLYRAVNLGPWLLHPYDYLGEFAAEKHAGGWNPHAFYPTPHALCEVMVRTQMSGTVKADLRGASVHDCCMGSARMLLHASNYSLFLSGQDIDGLMCQIAMINGALYAPWLLYPPPSRMLNANQATHRRLPPRRQTKRRPPPYRRKG